MTHPNARKMKGPLDFEHEATPIEEAIYKDAHATRIARSRQERDSSPEGSL